MFDGSVGDLGAVLIECDGEFRLIRSETEVLQQTSERAGPFVQDMADGPVRHALQGLSDLRSLRPISTGTAQIEKVALIDKEGKTRVRYSTFRLRPKTGEGVSLITVEGLRGYEKSRARLCAGIEAGAKCNAPADLQSVLAPDFEPHSAKPAVPLARTDTAFFAACDLINGHIPVARATEPGVIEDLDTEYLHDYRVALRKIRSVLSLFKGVFSEDRTAELKQVFSDLMAPTGRLRDLDVYLLDKDVYFDMVPPALHPGLREMFRRFEAERASEHAQMAKRLKSRRYLSEMKKLEELFATPEQLEPGPVADVLAYDYARRLIWKRYRKVCKIAVGIHADTDDEEVHELRIHCKKLRYLMEFFAPFFPKRDIKGLIKALKRLQDNLGLFNDYSVQQDSLAAFLKTQNRVPRAKATEMAQSIGALIAVLHRRQGQERARVMASFASFDSPEVRDTFRTLFRQEGDKG
ncbi:MAG: CHAD domain-containing protein [Paracoccaceae bacterium]